MSVYLPELLHTRLTLKIFVTCAADSDSFFKSMIFLCIKNTCSFSKFGNENPENFKSPIIHCPGAVIININAIFAFCPSSHTGLG